MKTNSLWFTFVLLSALNLVAQTNAPSQTQAGEPGSINSEQASTEEGSSTSSTNAVEPQTASTQSTLPSTDVMASGPVVVLPDTISPDAKRIMLPVDDKGKIIVKNVAESLHPKPGDVLVIPADKEIRCIQLKEIHGTPEKPIFIEGENSSVTIGGFAGYNLYIDDSQYFVVRKFNIDGKLKGGYGMHIIGSDFIIEDMVVRNIKGFGVQVKKDPVVGNDTTAWPKYAIKNVVLRRIKVYDTTVEGFYIGHTNSQLKNGMRPAQIVGLIMEDLEAHNSGWDGIQISSARRVTARNLKIENYGTRKTFGQNSGLTIQQNTQVDLVENVDIQNGSGAGLSIFGRDVMTIKNVNIKNAGYDGVYVDDYPDPELKPLQLNLENITIDGAKRAAIKIVNKNGTMIPGTFKNIVYKNTSEKIIDHSKSHIVGSSSGM